MGTTPNTGPPPSSISTAPSALTTMGGLWPAFANFNSPVAGSSTLKKNVMNRLLGHLAHVVLFKRDIKPPRSPGSSASTCTRACKAIIMSEAGIPFPETSPNASATRPSAYGKKSK